MNPLWYLGLLIAALVAFAVFLDRRWKSYSADCYECLRRERALAKLAAESEREIWAEAHVAQALAAAKSRDLSSVAPVLEFPTQRTAGDQS